MKKRNTLQEVEALNLEVQVGPYGVARLVLDISSARHVDVKKRTRNDEMFAQDRYDDDDVAIRVGFEAHNASVIAHAKSDAPDAREKPGVADRSLVMSGERREDKDHAHTAKSRRLDDVVEVRDAHAEAGSDYQQKQAIACRTLRAEDNLDGTVHTSSLDGGGTPQDSGLFAAANEARLAVNHPKYFSLVSNLGAPNVLDW